MKNAIILHGGPNKSVEYLIDNHIPFTALRDGEAIVINGKNQEVVS